MNQKLNENILNEISDFNIGEKISLEDVEKIEKLFKNESNIEPPKALFENIMENLDMQYENEKMHSKKAYKGVVSSINELFIYIKAQIILLDKSFWIISTIFMLLGVFFIVDSKIYLINLVSPFIILFSIYYMYRGFYNNVYEMEVACKYSIYEITLARSIVIICYNILFSSLIGIVCFIISDVNLFIFIIVSWLGPLLLTYYISLYFFFKKGIVYSVVSNVFVWLTYIFLFCKIFGDLGLNSANYNNLSWLYINMTLMIISLVLIIILLKQVKENFKDNSEGAVAK